jgi:hypothetical protein
MFQHTFHINQHEILAEMIERFEFSVDGGSNEFFHSSRHLGFFEKLFSPNSRLTKT